ncbi:MAG: 3-phosphoshikimate 1-carboxyvinyltransferase [Fibrobacteres bacterium]|jgi:3-phosphoshikimate 1-carboxyvinyltransferase|nr:3-phosphoshikimate 1-carboxyvinyltransferase [Fibrobacterota bacterium]
MDTLVLAPARVARGSVRPPGSKSIGNRVLPLAALAGGVTRLGNLPDGEDVELMRAALLRLGVPMREDGGNLEVTGCGGPIRSTAPVELFLGNSGTATRFLTALLAAGRGTFTVDGVARMRERPIRDLVEALRPLSGATRIAYTGAEGFPPLRIDAQGLAGGTTRIKGDVSSQFLTGLLMTLPLCQGPVEVEVEGALVSAPYVDLTLRIMETFGVTVINDRFRRFSHPGSRAYVSPGRYEVEPDASSASYFLAAGAIAGGPVEVRGIGKDSLQGEARFATMLERMGAKVEYGRDFIRVAGAPLKGIDADMDLMSDTGMTLAVAALFAQGPTLIRNIGNWRVKETDRIRAMATELRKVGAIAEEGPDWLRIEPPATLRGAEIDTYQDHRMAMCFSLVSLGGVPVTIRDPGCVRKTYPGYFEAFRALTAA